MQEPLLLPFNGISPALRTDPQYCGHQVSLVGRLEIGANAWFGHGAVLRGDGHFVRVGDDFRLGQRGTVHIAHERYPTIVGDRVTAGHGAVIHACTVGNDCVIEEGVIILDGATVEDGVIIEAGAVVFGRSTLQAGWVYAGSPAKPLREVEPGELDRRAKAVSDAIFASIFESGTAAASTGDAHQDGFVGHTAIIEGPVKLGPGAGVYFGCRLNGHAHGIRIGANCNIQDNSFIDASNGPVTIGDNATVGHNVDMKSCTIGARSLVGIGSTLSEGTVVGEDVLLAAGSTTQPGQELGSGWLWGGRPARQIAPLDEAKRAMLAMTVEQYLSYSIEYDRVQCDRPRDAV